MPNPFPIYFRIDTTIVDYCRTRIGFKYRLSPKAGIGFNDEMKRISCISIIDDDQLFQYSIKKVLQSTDIIDNILQFQNGEAALNYLLKNKDNAAMLPEIIFLDLHMPLMDGWQFLEEFTSNTAVAKKTTIYICTSSMDHTNQERFKSYNKLSGYIIKPIRKNEIYELLDNELNSSYAAISPNIVLG